MKYKKSFSGILTAAVLSFSVITLSANSAMTRWEGTDRNGAVSAEEDCPLIVEKEVLTFDLAEVPVIQPADQHWDTYSGSVTAEYTFYNPSDLDVTAHLVFPFGTMPMYAHFSGETGTEAFRNAEKDHYKISVNGEAIRPVLRHTWQGLHPFSLQEDMPLLFEDDDDFYRDDLPVTVCTYSVQDVDPQYTAAAVRAPLSADPSKTRYSVFPFNGGTFDDNKTEIQVWADVSTITLVIYGEVPDQEPEWTFYENGQSEKVIEGSMVLTGKESCSFREWALQSYQKDSEILEQDYVNAYRQMLIQDCVNGNIITEPESTSLPEGRLMRWYAYEIHTGPGERIVNSVTAPMYPDIDEGYKDPVYTYNYLLSPASSWKEFHDLDVYIHTDLKQLRNSLEGFEEVSGGYQAHFDSLPEKELEFDLCAVTHPQRKNNSGTLYLLIFLVPLVLGFILFFAVIIFILKLIFRKKQS